MPLAVTHAAEHWPAFMRGSMRASAPAGSRDGRTGAVWHIGHAARDDGGGGRDGSTLDGSTLDGSTGGFEAAVWASRA